MLFILHYYQDNLLLDYDEADQQLLQRSFRRFAKARPLHQSNMVLSIFFCFASIYISLCVFNSVHMFFNFSSLYCMRSIGLFLWLTLMIVILYFLIHCIAAILSIIKILKEGLYVLYFFLLLFNCLLLFFKIFCSCVNVDKLFSVSLE